MFINTWTGKELSVLLFRVVAQDQQGMLRAVAVDNGTRIRAAGDFVFVVVVIVAIGVGVVLVVVARRICNSVSSVTKEQKKRHTAKDWGLAYHFHRCRSTLRHL